MKTAAKVLVSATATALAGLHQFFPGFHLEPMTLTLLGVAVLVWLLKYVEGIDIPGVGSISLRDTKSATDKIDIRTRPDTSNLKIKSHRAAVTKSDEIHSYFEIIEPDRDDARLILIAFRMEVELRVRTLVRVHELLNDRVDLNRMIRALVAKEIIDSKTATGLTEIIALGNQAAHGVKVESDAAAWVRDIGPNILDQLDQAIASAQGAG